MVIKKRAMNVFVIDKEFETNKRNKKEENKQDDDEEHNNDCKDNNKEDDNKNKITEITAYTD